MFYNPAHAPNSSKDSTNPYTNLLDVLKCKKPFLWVCFIIFTLLNPASLQAKEQIKLLLDWFINPDHAPILIAKELGFFAKNGLEVELIEPADPSAPPYQIANGIGDIAISYQPQLHLHVTNGIPIVKIGTLIETPLNTLVSLKDGPIKTIADFKGKRIGTTFAPYENILLNAMLKDAGLTIDDVEIVVKNFDLATALIKKDVDGIIGAYRNFELNQLELRGYPGRAFYPEEHGVPVYDELIFITQKKLNKKDNYISFMASIEEAVLWLTNHPEQALQIVITAYPHLDTEFSYRSWRDTIPRFSKRPAAIDYKRYEDYAKFMEKVGLIENSPPVKDYVKNIYTDKKDSTPFKIKNTD